MSESGGTVERRVQVRWQDLDGLGHVNHAVVLTYLEEGRDAFLREHGIPRDEYVVGRCSVSFNGEIDPGQESVTVSCGVRELGRKSMKTTETDRRSTAASRRRGRVRARPLGPAGAQQQIDHRRRARVARPDGGRARMSAWNENPVVVTCAITGADVFRENNPNIPYTTAEIADSAIGAGRAGATIAHLHVREDDGTPSGRPGAVHRRHRPDPGRERHPHDGLDGRLQRHDDRGADHGPRGQARHLRRRVGLDELRRRDLHHAAAGGARDRQARDRRRHRARGRGLRRRPRRQRRALARAGRSSRAR